MNSTTMKPLRDKRIAVLLRPKVNLAGLNLILNRLSEAGAAIAMIAHCQQKMT